MSDFHVSKSEVDGKDNGHFGDATDADKDWAKLLLE